MLYVFESNIKTVDEELASSENAYTYILLVNDHDEIATMPEINKTVSTDQWVN